MEPARNLSANQSYRFSLEIGNFYLSVWQVSDLSHTGAFSVNSALIDVLSGLIAELSVETVEDAHHIPFNSFPEKGLSGPMRFPGTQY